MLKEGSALMTEEVARNWSSWEGRWVEIQERKSNWTWFERTEGFPHLRIVANVAEVS